MALNKYRFILLSICFFFSQKINAQTFYFNNVIQTQDKVHYKQSVALILKYQEGFFTLKWLIDSSMVETSYKYVNDSTEKEVTEYFSQPDTCIGDFLFKIMQKKNKWYWAIYRSKDKEVVDSVLIFDSEENVKKITTLRFFKLSSCSYGHDGQFENGINVYSSLKRIKKFRTCLGTKSVYKIELIRDRISSDFVGQEITTIYFDAKVLIPIKFSFETVPQNGTLSSIKYIYDLVCIKQE